MSFLRVKLIEANFEEGGAVPADPFCAVKILEVQSQNDDGEPQLTQKKKTFYPQWNRCFDSHLVQGRRMQVIVMDKQVGRRSPALEPRERETDGFALSYYRILPSCFVPSPPITQEGGNDRPVAQVTVETELLAAECREETDGHVVKLEVCTPLASGGRGGGPVGNQRDSL